MVDGIDSKWNGMVTGNEDEARRFSGVVYLTGDLTCLVLSGWGTSIVGT